METASRGIGMAPKRKPRHAQTARRAHTYTRLLNNLLLLLRLESHRALTPIHHLPRRRRRDRNPPPLFPSPEDRTGRPWNGRPR